MPLPFALRFDFRNPPIAGTTMAERYRAALDIVEWADRRGCMAVSISEHHGSDDGYLPSPLVMLAAMAARTESVRFMVAALIAPFYDPLRLAEDMFVLDHLSGGRVDLIVAGGYVRDEFEMYGVPASRRARMVTEVVETLREAAKGEPFEFRGRTVRVTPSPLRPSGPALLLGGSSEAAARRAARIADGFLPSTPDVWSFYCEEMAALGKADPGPCPVDDTTSYFLADKPDQAWEELGPFLLHENNAYGAWLRENDGVGPYDPASDLDELRESGPYRIMTPQEYCDHLAAMPFPFASFHPMCGGIPPELAWRSLRLFESQVVPAFG